MRRGFLQFTPSELNLLSDFLLQNSPLSQKLQTNNLDSKESIPVELSSEEVETLLDSLPIPSSAENPELKFTRSKLSEFLT